ncbi:MULTISPECIES: NUDIX hydrolase [unclassified Embleya]|uniref:NUDIX hydrolase n=1 Tax=unclassified Embleya TaxID=2699296 RepID=UPI0033F29718
MPIDQETPGSPAPIRRQRAVEVFGNRYGRLYNDDVLSPGGRAGKYLRWQWSHTGVVVVARGPAGIALVPTYRYPLGAASLEFPRGGCEAGESPADAGARELREEAGLIAATTRDIGLLHAETGLIESAVHVVSATVLGGPAEVARPETMESVAEPVWVSHEGMLDLLGQGRVTCGVTLAAFALVLAADRSPSDPS